jgi:hypothetical protein
MEGGAMLEMFEHKPSLSKVKRGMSAADAEKLLAEDYRVVSDFDNGVEQWEVWHKDGRLSYPAAEIYLVDSKIHSIDEYLCRPFSGDAVDFAESFFQALASLMPSGKGDKLAADVSVVLDRSNPPGAQQKDIGIWLGETGIGIHIWAHDQNTRRLVLKKCR